MGTELGEEGTTRLQGAVAKGRLQSIEALWVCSLAHHQVVPVVGYYTTANHRDPTSQGADEVKDDSTRTSHPPKVRK